MPVFFAGIGELRSLERFKKVIAMAVAGLYISPSQEKPFNPLLGETLQAYWPDGTKAYCEHTSHHPPITNFYVVSKDFKMHGNLQLVGRFKKNSLVGGFQGIVNIEFNDGQIISYNYPQFKAGGMIMGSRIVEWEERMNFEDKKNKYESTLTFGAVRRKNLFRKAIGKVDDLRGELKINDQEICKIEGNWLKNLVIDEEEY